MIVSRCDPEFWKELRKLPRPVQRAAMADFKKWKADPGNRDTAGKFIKKKPLIYRVKICHNAYRAVAVVEGDQYYWFFIGTHAQYDQVRKNV